MPRKEPPSVRSVINFLGPPLAFLAGGGILPPAIGYCGQVYTFASGIILTGVLMLCSPVLAVFLKLGQYDDLSGC
ncbi:MAG: hypothetical protein GY874_10300 [Desulfobacteraceae bacterium]|nr:hypothetical protein [Desulfobacteraceae bacterium]